MVNFVFFNIHNVRNHKNAHLKTLNNFEMVLYNLKQLKCLFYFIFLNKKIVFGNFFTEELKHVVFVYFVMHWFLIVYYHSLFIYLFLYCLIFFFFFLFFFFIVFTHFNSETQIFFILLFSSFDQINTCTIIWF